MSLPTKIAGLLQSLFGLKQGSGNSPIAVHQGTANGYTEAWRNAAGTTVVTIGADGNGQSNVICYDAAGTAIAFVGAISANVTAIRLDAGHQLCWGNGGALTGSDTGLQKVAPGVVGPTDGGANVRWLQDAGRTRMTTAPTNATTNLANGVLTDLSQPLLAGRKYTGALVLFAKDSTAADGLAVDFNGGSATVTSVLFGIGGAPGATVGTATSAALGTAVTLTSMGVTGDIVVTIPVEVVCNAAGTFIPRFAQAAHSTGTATVEIGSYLTLNDSTN